MPTLTHEQTINTSLAEVLEDLGRGWTILSEPVGPIFKEGGRPDILVNKPDGWPIVLEAEVGNHSRAEDEARSRLGKQLVLSATEIHASIAVVYPDELRKHSGAALRKALRSIKMEYALLTWEADDSISRFPGTGWISGGIADLAILVHRSSIPAWRVEKLADELEFGVKRAEGSFSLVHPRGAGLGQSIANHLGQIDDEDGQTRRMAMTVVTDALIFHAALSEAAIQVPSNPERSLRSPGELREHGNFRPTLLLDEWDRILEVNYWPIFLTAGKIIKSLPTQMAATILGELWATAEKLIVGGVTKSHDLTGVVFQRLIADRKFLATYYTRPSGAALLAGLALPIQTPVVGASWSDAETLAQTRIGDFACGTGTLLSTAYQRLGLLHQVHGGDPKAIHPALMEHGLVGLDVLTVAVHLTAAMLAGSYPDKPFSGECLLTMPYGSYEWGVCLGSLDLLSEQPSFDIFQAAAKTAGGRGTKEVRDQVQKVGHEQFDLVIMNPPFTRHGAREGNRTEIHNPAFAAFGASEQEQDRLSKHLKTLARGGQGHGHAGMATFFTDLAHRKTSQGGTLALVLPLTALSGAAWEGIRCLWRRNYCAPLVVTIAGDSSFNRSFSADTGMAECLFVGRKKTSDIDIDGRARFVVLNAQPSNTLEGEQIAQAISRVIAEGATRRLEDGPFGGTRIVIGDTHYGDIIEAPLPQNGPWQIVGMKDISLAQTSYQLSTGRLWIEGMNSGDQVSLPMAKIEEISVRIGPHHLDIAGKQPKADGLPQGPFERLSGCTAGDAYPSLWNHDSQRERRLVVEPDSHCRVREVQGAIPPTLMERAQSRWETAAHAHYNLDLQFNSQSIIVAITPSPSLGGRAWPTVVFEDHRHEIAFALWGNSSLGLLVHWWMSNKSQAGRGTSTKTSILDFIALDVRQLSDAQLETAQLAFDELKNARFLPFDQIDEDPVRAKLDRFLLVDVLGLSEDLCAIGGPMERLRAKLAVEPQIHSDKRTRVVFTEAGETSEPRAR